MLFFKFHSMVSRGYHDVVRDRKILPAPGTNQIAGFGGYCPLAALRKAGAPFALVKTEITPNDFAK